MGGLRTKISSWISRNKIVAIVGIVIILGLLIAQVTWYAGVYMPYKEYTDPLEKMGNGRYELIRDGYIYSVILPKNSWIGYSKGYTGSIETKHVAPGDIFIASLTMELKGRYRLDFSYEESYQFIVDKDLNLAAENIKKDAEYEMVKEKHHDQLDELAENTRAVFGNELLGQ